MLPVFVYSFLFHHSVFAVTLVSANRELLALGFPLSPVRYKVLI
jgi:hypothetical protein